MKQHRFLARYGPWAVVTGASDGIGRAIAVDLAARGLSLVLVARRREVLEALAVVLRERHSIQVQVHAADLSSAEAVEQLAGSTASLDVGLVVAAAGFGGSGPLLEADLATELGMVDVNCRALLHVSVLFGRRLVKRGKGGLVLFSSLVAFQGVPRAANYAATKAYVQSLAEGLRLEIGQHGVDVLASAPGPVVSGFGARADMHITSGLTPQQVARGTLAALGGSSSTVRPGFLSKFLEASLSLLPRWGRSLALAHVMHGMTKHQQSLPGGTR